ncbi:MAG: CxxxxCH/CxxCH domain-containing protein [Ignavibacteriales bacterium]|nr:CxxxxCH/CxxCH domain-containing protein [Ignavibacteriales bacterium]
MKTVLRFFSWLAVPLLLTGCSNLKDTLPATTQTAGVHPEGWISKTSADFHGAAIRAQGWDMRTCQTCHGSRYNGGTSGVSCLTCHTGGAGPENCSTCHGSATSPAPPRDLNGNTANTARGVGAHQVHLMGTTRAKALTCAECHSIPGSVYEPGHVDSDPPAEVLMGNYLANLQTNLPTTSRYSASLPLFDPNPAYDPATTSCSSAYCHGTFKNGNPTNTPVWNNPASAACGTCHGDPTAATTAQKALPKTSAQGGTHTTNTNCANCHGGVVDASLRFINASKHIDGKLNLFGSDIEY